MRSPLAPSECRALDRLAGSDRPTAKELAADLGWTVPTVKTVLMRAYRKLGVHSRYEAMEKHRRLRGHTCRHLLLEREREAAI